MSRNGRHKVLVLGSRGLVGRQVFNELAKDSANYKVYGTLRDYNDLDSQILNEGGEKILVQDLTRPTELHLLLNRLEPHSIVNCLSIASHQTASERNLKRTFSLLPQTLAKMAKQKQARVVNISSDAVFSGKAALPYSEKNIPDATDYYGKAKIQGEVDANNVVNLRASLIGFDPYKKSGLLENFLANEGFTPHANSIFSALPAKKFAIIMKQMVLPRNDIYGTFHVGSEPISKSDCLRLIAKHLGHSVNLLNDYSVVMNRALDTRLFEMTTGYRAQTWQQLVSFVSD